jgi:hypothetical protein
LQHAAHNSLVGGSSPPGADRSLHFFSPFVKVFAFDSRIIGWSDRGARHGSKPVKARAISEPLRALLDSKARGRQFRAARLVQLAGTRAGRFGLTRQGAAGKWGKATYSLVRTAKAAQSTGAGDRARGPLCYQCSKAPGRRIRSLPGHLTHRSDGKPQEKDGQSLAPSIPADKGAPHTSEAQA